MTKDTYLLHLNDWGIGVEMRKYQIYGLGILVELVGRTF